MERTPSDNNWHKRVWTFKSDKIGPDVIKIEFSCSITTLAEEELKIKSCPGKKEKKNWIPIENSFECKYPKIIKTTLSAMTNEFKLEYD